MEQIIETNLKDISFNNTFKKLIKQHFSLYTTKFSYKYIQLFQLRLSPEQSGKVKYERERLLAIVNKCISDSQQPFALVFHFARGTTLIEIAVYIYIQKSHFLYANYADNVHALSLYKIIP